MRLLDLFLLIYAAYVSYIVFQLAKDFSFVLVVTGIWKVSTFDLFQRCMVDCLSTPECYTVITSYGQPVTSCYSTDLCIQDCYWKYNITDG